jgi:hypothetical protein
MSSSAQLKDQIDANMQRSRQLEAERERLQAENEWLEAERERLKVEYERKLREELPRFLVNWVMDAARVSAKVAEESLLAAGSDVLLATELAGSVSQVPNPHPIQPSRSIRNNDGNPMTLAPCGTFYCGRAACGPIDGRPCPSCSWAAWHLRRR